MRTRLLLAGAAIALTSTLALASPESLLPPSFQNNPAPAARPAPAPARTAAAPSVPGPAAQPRAATTAGAAPAAVAPITLPSNLPSLSELEKMDPDQLDQLFGLKPKYDVPPGARRGLDQVGVIAESEGGFPAGSLAPQPGALVQAAIEGIKQPLVSRWGHILLRRVLASRLDAPRDLDPADFAAMRASLLDRLGEGGVARALVQDVDSANYNPPLATAAFDAYLDTGDLLGICPVVELQPKLLDTPEWQLTQSICRAYSGHSQDAGRALDRAFYYGLAPRIDVLLAQRFAGAAGESRRDITIEWTGVNALNPWRFSLARTLGVDLPDSLRKNAPAQYDFADVLIPAVPLPARAAAADRAAAAGTMSSQAMVDLYSQLWADPSIDDADKKRAGTLRQAYLATDAGARLDAMHTLWGTGGQDYGGQVLTAYAAARLPVSKSLLDDAPAILSSMLTAGLDRNAVLWGPLVPQGSPAWALLVLAQPSRATTVSSGGVNTFINQDKSADQRKAKFLVAGLAGLGRLDANTAAGLANDLKFNLAGETVWTRKIDKAADVNNAALVALLAGLGMQGDGWDKMTPRHLFHIVRDLNRAGLGGEARMIAAEAVARA